MRRRLLVTGRAAPQRPSSPAPGSTLLELIVVLAIVGLLFGVAIPAMTAIPEARSVRSSIDSARALAASEGRLVRTDSVVALPDGRLLVRGGNGAW